MPAPTTNQTVVITGCGIVSPLGSGMEENASGLREGRTAFSDVTLFDVSRQRVKTAGQVRLPDSSDLPPHARKRMDRSTLLAWHAAREAMKTAGLSGDSAMPFVVGTSAVAMPLGEDYFHAAQFPQTSRKAQLHRVETYLANRQIKELAAVLRIGGPHVIISNACASGANALGSAFHMVRSGKAERVLAGGYDALCQLVFAGFDSLQALAVSGIPRPFDAARDGLALGEGAAFFVVESESSALARSAEILCRISGYAAATDIHHLTQPHPDGDTALRTMTAACEMAGLSPTDIGYLNSHGTGTPLNDIAEGNAIRRWAGDDVGKIRVSSTKSAIGHLLGAAGAVEAAFCLLALRHQFLPASLNVREADPVCTFDLIREPRDASLDHAMTNSFGFGGANASLILSSWSRQAAPSRGGDSLSPPITITGTGAVTHVGWGIAPLLSAIRANTPPSPTPLHRPQGNSTVETSVLRVPSGAPPLPHPRLRRASPISKFAAAAALEALGLEKTAAIREGRLRCGVIFSLTNGCVNYTNRFFAEVTQDPSLASPILFPETVFNAPSSHISALIGSTAPNDTLLGDASAFATALGQARDWINYGIVDACLVVTAEEIDWLSAEALAFYRSPYLPAEGAAAILLEKSSTGTPIPDLPACASTLKPIIGETMGVALGLETVISCF